MARKLALIIGNSHYDDTGLSRLAAPDVDVRALANVLETPGIGGFDEVLPLLNEGLATVRKAIARFFDAKHRDDLLLLYFSGHGVRDEQGHLYLAVRDTERAVLAGTAIEASYVTTRMDRSASKRLVLVLDCCHSGAFGLGTKSAQGSTVGTASAFEGTGRGRVVLTATDSTQYAWEGDQVIGDVENSLFTHYMIEGLRTGAADRDEDGRVTVDELYDYVYDHVLNDTPKQTPGKWTFGQQGDIVIASNPSASRSRVPPEIEEALASKLASVRLEAVRELETMLRGHQPARAQAALQLLQKLTQDDSRRVASAAEEILKGVEPGPPAVQVEASAAVEILADEERKRLEQIARTLVARQEEERQRNEEEAAWLREEAAERERIERDRQAEIDAAVASARAALGRGDLEEAAAPVARALELSPDHEDAVRLDETLRRRLDERERLEQAEQHIRELRQRIATLIARSNGTEDHDEAIALLDEALGLDPEHAEVKQLLEARYRLRGEAETEEAERRARSIATIKDRVERHIERNELDEAARALASAGVLDEPETFAQLHAEVARLIDERGRAAEAAERKRADDDRRAREIDAYLDEAARHLEQGDLTQAIVLADVALRIDAEHEAARALHDDIQEAIEAQRKAEELAAQEQERVTAEAKTEAAADAQRAIEQASQRPQETPIGFSIRRTLSAPTEWVLTTVRRSASFRVVLGAILAVGLGLTVMKPGSERAMPSASTSGTSSAIPPQSTPPPAPVTTSPNASGAKPSVQAPPAPLESAPSPAPKLPEPAPAIVAARPLETKPPEPKPSEAVASDPKPAAPARNESVAAAERAARRLLNAGNGPGAMKTVLDGLAIDATDLGLTQVLRAIAADAKNRAEMAATEAARAGTHVTSSTAYADAMRAKAEGERLREPQPEGAARRYWRAAQLFNEAARTPPPAPPVAQANPTTKPPDSTPAYAGPLSAANPNAERRPAPSTDPGKPSSSPVRPPNASAPESPAWSAAAARPAIQRLLDQYEAALERRNVDAFKAIWPTMPRDKELGLRKALGGYKSLDLDVANCSPVFAPGGAAATVTCRERNQIRFPVGPPMDVRFETRFTLRPAGPSWVIVDWSRTLMPR